MGPTKEHCRNVGMRGRLDSAEATKDRRRQSCIHLTGRGYHGARRGRVARRASDSLELDLTRLPSLVRDVPNRACAAFATGTQRIEEGCRSLNILRLDLDHGDPGIGLHGCNRVDCREGGGCYGSEKASSERSHLPRRYNPWLVHHVLCFRYSGALQPVSGERLALRIPVVSRRFQAS